MRRTLTALALGSALSIAPVGVASAQPNLGSLGSLSTTPAVPNAPLQILGVEGEQVERQDLSIHATVRVLADRQDEIQAVRVQYWTSAAYGPENATGTVEALGDTVSFPTGQAMEVHYIVSIQDRQGRWIEDDHDNTWVIPPLYGSAPLPGIEVSPYLRPMSDLSGAWWPLPVDNRLNCQAAYEQCMNAYFELRYSANPDMTDPRTVTVNSNFLVGARPEGEGRFYVQVRVVSNRGDTSPWSETAPIDFLNERYGRGL